MPTEEPLLELKGIQHLFTLPSGKIISVLGDINFSLYSGELVAVLGPSGCGKSTLIRILTGLLRPTSGEVWYRNHPMTGPQPNVTLVFQQFALYPWLTVAQNIEQALISRHIERDVRQHRVAEVIGMIGLEGFDEAYPRELSGGMKQRVGIARALVVGPEVLCMDEPFSQVDAFTAETLRNEVINLWRDREKYPQSIFLVSHDINEVVFMASRILIMTSDPGRIKTIIENPLPYPRDPRMGQYQALVARVHGILTGLYMPEAETVTPPVSVREGFLGTRMMVPVPLVEVRDIIGLLEALSARGGDIGLFRLTTEMGQTFTRILLATKAAELLNFLETPQERLLLTALGRQFLAAPRKARKQLFQQQFTQIQIVKRLREMLEHSPEGRLDKELILEELAIQCPQEDTKRLFRTLLNWGRFAEVWLYSSAQEMLILMANGAGRKTTHP